MSYAIFLDDERFPWDVTWVELPPVPHGDFVLIRNQKVFEDVVSQLGIPDYISFDNDLGDGMGEGIFCAQWMVDQVLDGKLAWNPNFQFTVHSKNNQAGPRITGLLNNFIKHMEASGED